MLAAFVASAFLLQGAASTPTLVAVDTMVDVGGYRVHCRIHRGTMPLTILMWNNREREDRAWHASHEAIVAAAPKRRLVVAENSGHQIELDRPDTVIDAVVSLVENRNR